MDQNDQTEVCDSYVILPAPAGMVSWNVDDTYGPVLAVEVGCDEHGRAVTVRPLLGKRGKAVTAEDPHFDFTPSA